MLSLDLDPRHFANLPQTLGLTQKSRFFYVGSVDRIDISKVLPMGRSQYPSEPLYPLSYACGRARDYRNCSFWDVYTFVEGPTTDEDVEYSLPVQTQVVASQGGRDGGVIDRYAPLSFS